MKQSLKRGMSFGLVSSIVTILGIMIGMYSLSHSKIYVAGSILLVAFSDSLSDALGMHISEESVTKNKKNIWNSTYSTLISKIFFSLSFLIPILLFELKIATILATFWGIILLITISYLISEKNKLHSIFEHLTIATIVIVLTYYLGKFIPLFFS